MTRTEGPCFSRMKPKFPVWLPREVQMVTWRALSCRSITCRTTTCSTHGSCTWKAPWKRCIQSRAQSRFSLKPLTILRWTYILEKASSSRWRQEGAWWALLREATSHPWISRWAPVVLASWSKVLSARKEESHKTLAQKTCWATTILTGITLCVSVPRSKTCRPSHRSAHRKFSQPHK